MVGIVGGTSLGLELTSLRMLREQGQIGDPTHGRSGEAVYVNVSTGNLVVQDIDDRLVGRGPDLPALRTYNSRGIRNDDNGDGWTNGIALRPLVLAGNFNAAGSTIERTDRDGSVATYRWVAANVYATDEGEGATDTLTFISTDNQVEWRDGSTGATQRYEATVGGKLLFSRDPGGNALTYAYDTAGNLKSVTTANGDVSYYDYVGANLTQIRTVTASGVTSTSVRYEYDTSNRLKTVTVDLSPGDNSVADGQVYQTTYTYDAASGLLATLQQTDGTSLTFTYTGTTGNYRLATIRDALGGVTTFTYGAASGGLAPTTVTAPDNVQTRFDIDAASLTLRKITTAGIQTAVFTYTPTNDLATFQDGASRTTNYTYDGAGNLATIADSASTTTRTYDGRNQILTETIAGSGISNTTRDVYDTAGRNQLRFLISSEGRVTEHRYDAFGQRVATIVYAGAAYPVAGLSSTTSPQESTLVSWTAAQNAATTQRVDMTYDARGQLATRTSYANVDTSGAGVLDGSQSLEQFVYDQAGRLLKVIAPRGGVATFTYDGLGRERTRTDAKGQTTLTQYLDAARKTVLTLANGLVTTSLYDARGSLLSVVDATAASATLGETKYFYDTVGRLRMAQDPTGVRRWVLYDGLGRKVAEVDGNGTLTESGYDGSSRLISSTTYANAVNTAALVDAAGVPILTATLASIRPAADNADLSEWRSYDGMGRLFRVARATGPMTAAVTENRYDAASRLVETVKYANVLTLDGVTIVPGSVGAPVASAADRSSRSFYDADGRLLATLDAEGYLVKNVYTAAGQLAERIAYATATTTSLRATGTLAQLVPAASAADARTVYLRDAQGRVIGEVDAEGYLTETVYDTNGNAATTVRYANRTTGTVTSSSSLASVRPGASANDRVTTRSFDALDRLEQETSPEGVVTQYAYDSGGRLLSTTRAAGTAEVRAVLARYDLQGRMVGELSAEGAALLTGGQTQAQIDGIWQQYGKTHVYDAAGRRVSTTDAAGNRTLFFYNADGALTHTVNALGEVQETRYDVQGRVSLRIAYFGRIATAGLSGGLVPSALTTALAAIADPVNDSKTTITYARDGSVQSTTDAEGYLTTFAINGFGERIGSTQVLGGGASLVQTFTLDKRGLLIGTVSDSASVNAITSTVFDAFGRAVRTVDANGNVRDQVFDRLGRQVVTIDPLNAARSTTYDAFDRVLTQIDALGRTTTFAYDKVARTMTVTTPEGIATRTGYSRHGQVLSIADGKGQVTTYTYDANGQLKQTTTPLLSTTSSAYDGAGRLIRTTDANGNQVTYTYDAASRVFTRTVDANGLNLLTRYDYDGKGQQVKVTDPNGIATTTAFDRKGLLVRQTVDPAGLKLQTTWTYDGAGRVLTVTSPAGGVTRMDYDALGRRIRERVDPDGLNLTRTWAYDKAGNVLTSTDPLQQVTRFVSDAAGRPVFAIDPLGNVRETAYDAEGRVVRSAAYATPINPAAIPATPTIASIQGLVVRQPALDVVEHRVYDRDGRLTWTVDGTGGAVRYDDDANGNVAVRTAFANRIDMATWVPGTVPVPVADAVHDARTSTVYDALNRALFTVDGIGAVVATSYDGNGNVLQRTAYAAAVPVTTAPTAAAVTAAVALVANAARDASTRYVYDAANRLAWSVDGVGAVTQRTYDKSGNLVRQVDYATPIAAGAAPSSVVASGTDRSTSMAYDAANRLVFQVDALRGVTEQGYDAAGRVIRRTAYANPIASVPTLGQPGTEAAIRAMLVMNSGTDRSSRFAYDAAGRCVFDVDPQGAVTQTGYDAAGQAISVTRYAKLVDGTLLGSIPTFGTIQAQVRPDTQADRTVLRAFDASGRLAYEVDPLGAVRGLQYDGTGRVARTVRYAKAIPGGTPGTLAGIGGALLPAPDADRVETTSYNAAGQCIATTDALGSTETFSYDALGRKLSFTNKKGAVWTYDSDAAGRLVKETSPQVDLASVATNAAGDLVLAAASAPASVVTRLAYDALGHLVERTEAQGRPEQRTTRYEYDALGRQVRVVYPAVGVYDIADNPAVNGATGVASRTEVSRALESRTYYDTFGNAVANVDVGDALSQKAYDLNGNVAFEVDALGYVTGYQRNAFGEVTSLVRYGGKTSLAGSSVTQATQAASRAQVDVALAAPGFSHAADRALLTSYDRAGRVLETVEPTAYVYDASAAAGSQAASVGKTTRTTYNAFGEAIEVKQLRNPTTGTWSVTTHYYDRAGREAATVDALGYLTTRKFDVVGNLTMTREWATALVAGAWTVGSYGLPATSADDRQVEVDFDRLDRKVAERRLDVEYSDAPNGASTRGLVTTTFGYDAVGNQVWVTDALGSTTFTYFDKLGRVEKVAAPPRSSTANGAVLTPLTEYRRDAYGNVIARIEYANGAASANQAAAVAAAPSVADRITLSRYDSIGHVVQATDANGSSEFSSYDAWGHLAKNWRGVTDGDGATRTSFQVNVYDKLGQLLEARTPASTSALAADGRSIATVTQAQAGLVTTAMDYNAFGEMTRRGTQGGWQEYFDYDTAGRLWRTNTGDGVDRINLYDALGNVTAELRSAGAGRDNVNIGGFANAQAADASLSTRRVDFSRDALGRVVRQTEAARLDLQGGVTVQRALVSVSGIVAALPGSGANVINGSEAFPWGTPNRVNLAWNSLAGLGSGDVKVTVVYQTPLVEQPVIPGETGSYLNPTYTGGTTLSYTSGVYSSEEAATGLALSWAETSPTSDGGIGRVSRVVVYKKDVNGNWNAVLDQAPGYGRNAIDVAAPPDASAAVTLEMRAAGTAGDTGWWSAPLTNFGSALRFDALGLAVGSYEYRVKVKSPTESAARTIGTGTVSITMPPLGTITSAIDLNLIATGLLSWPAMAPGTDQVFRYRPVAGGAWATLPTERMLANQFDTIDTKVLGAGTYQFELLWMPAGSGSPTSHAVGQFTITPPQPPRWVPPENLTEISGLAIGVVHIGGLFQGFDEITNEARWSGGTTVPALQWNATDATLVRYRVPGGAWSTLAIDNTEQLHDEGTPFGYQKVALSGLVAGTYEMQVLVGSPPTSQGWVTLTIPSPPPGYYTTVTEQVPTQQPIIAYYAPVYETRYATRQVAYTVWVNDPPVIAGYDEYGQPYYDYPGHYETRYYTETYSYQVQVGQTPVYATDEYGTLIYQTVFVTQQRQVWVQPPTPAPSIVVTTPPYKEGYTIPATPTLYGGLQVTTAPGSGAVSTIEGSAFSQSAAINGGDRWLRPGVEKKVDRWGNVVEVSDPRFLSWRTQYRFNASNQLVQETRPDAAGGLSAGSPVNRIYFDKLGRQVAVRDANDHVNGQVFDAGGNLTEERHADGGTVVHRYDAFGNKAGTTDAEGNAVQFAYDRLGHLTSMNRGLAGVWTVLASGNQLFGLGTRDIVATWSYDQLGRKLTQTNGNGETVRYAYDLRGNVVDTRQPLGQAVRAAFDAQGRKVAEVDANGAVAKWRYDYFGQLKEHTDLEGKAYGYSYDNARQLVRQTSERGQNLEYGYDAAGQQISITDYATGKVSTFAYDLAGRRIREKVVQGGVTYQDNHLSYDTQGRLRDVADARVHIVMEYDKVGNRTHVTTAVDYRGTAGEASATSDRYFLYDAMSRQRVVDAVDAAGNLGQQGHQIGYDKNGNRTFDTSWSKNRVVTSGGQQMIAGYDPDDGHAYYYQIPVTYTQAEGLSTETYRYDKLNRLQSVERDGMQIDLRHYDGADRVVQSGPPSNLPQGYADVMNAGLAPGQVNGKEMRINRYDANGRLVHQKILKSDGSATKSEISWDRNEVAQMGASTFSADGYDAAGNALGYVVQSWDGTPYMNEFSTTLQRAEGYQAASTTGTSTLLQSGVSTQQYDANGFLVGITDTTQSNNNRTFVNDDAGRALWVRQAGNVQRQLVVNGEVLGTYGAGVDPVNPPSGSNNNPNFANLVDFDFGYARISASYPNASPGAYQVRTGDTLQTIAQSAYGDSKLWYRIADANGLSSNTDLKVGQTLTIPAGVGTISNDATTFKPYDPSRITGDTAPSLAMPAGSGGGCGGVGQLLMVIVAVVVTIYTAGTLSGATGGFLQSMGAGMGVMEGTVTAATVSSSAAMATLGTAGTMAVSAAAGAVASQIVGLATGTINRFDWKGVAVSAVSAGVTQGLFPAAAGESTLATMARYAAASAVTQGIGVVTGLQKRFDWRAVAASSVAAGVSAEVGPALKKSLGDTLGASMTGLAAGSVAALMRGGRVSVQQVATDAFGNALGSIIASSGSGDVSRNPSSAFYENEMDRASDRFNPAIVYDYRNGADVESDLAAPRNEFANAVNRFSQQSIDDYEGTELAALSLGGGLGLRVSRAPVAGTGLRANGGLGLSSASSGLGLNLSSGSGSTSLFDLGSRFVTGAFHGAVNMVWQPMAQALDLGQAGIGLVTSGKYEPYWLSGIGRNSASGMSYRETVTRAVLGSNPVTGIGLASYDLTSSALQGDWGGVAEGLGGMVGSYGLVKGGQRYFAPEPGAQLGFYRLRPPVDVTDPLVSPGGLLPPLYGREAANFINLQPTYLGGRTLSRVFDNLSAYENGAYWGERSYSSESAWRSGVAIPQRANWNKGTLQGEWQPADGSWGWGGKAAPQSVPGSSYTNKNWGFSIGWIQRGGDYQIWVPNSRSPSVIPPGAVTVKPTPWSKP